MSGGILHTCLVPKAPLFSVLSCTNRPLPFSPPWKNLVLPTSSSFPLRSIASKSEAVTISTDQTYGNKQVISITPLLYDYILSNVRETKILRELREETATMQGSQMQVSPDQAQLLDMLIQILGAKMCIEVGVYTGYSSLVVALVLPENGFLVACDRYPRCLEVAKKYYERAGVMHKVPPDQAQFLAMLVQILGAKMCIEVGVYTVEVDSLEAVKMIHLDIFY